MPSFCHFKCRIWPSSLFFVRHLVSQPLALFKWPIKCFLLLVLRPHSDLDYLFPVFIGAGEGWIPRWRHVRNDEKTLRTRYFDIGEHFNQRKYNKIPSEFGANCFGKRREDSGNEMGKFREHTIEEKRKFHNARQRRKRQKRATERKNSQEAKLRNEYANSKQHADKLRATASVYCRRWKDQCSENKRLRELLHKQKHRQTVSWTVYSETNAASKIQFVRPN